MFFKYTYLFSEDKKIVANFFPFNFQSEAQYLSREEVNWIFSMEIIGEKLNSPQLGFFSIQGYHWSFDLSLF
jgi:hypothetical protein